MKAWPPREERLERDLGLEPRQGSAEAEVTPGWLKTGSLSRIAV